MTNQETKMTNKEAKDIVDALISAVTADDEKAVKKFGKIAVIGGFDFDLAPIAPKFKVSARVWIKSDQVGRIYLKQGNNDLGYYCLNSKKLVSSYKFQKETTKLALIEKLEQKLASY